MRNFFFPYRLQTKTALNSRSDGKFREGFLLKIVTENSSVGYADVMPWPEFGDLSCAELIAKIKTNQSENSKDPLLATAVRNAINNDHSFQLLDAALKDFKNLNHGKQFENNLLWSFRASDELPDESIVKVKLSRDFHAEIDKINRLPWVTKRVFRFDFNSALDPNSALEEIKWLKKNFRAAIQYVEDPCAFSSTVWKELNSILPLALDWEFSDANFETDLTFQFLVIKPTRQNANHLVQECAKRNLKFTVTSAMDHPIGVLQSCVQAMQLQAQYPDLAMVSGCNTFAAYAFDSAVMPTVFSVFDDLDHSDSIKRKDFESKLRRLDFKQIQEWLQRLPWIEAK